MLMMKQIFKMIIQEIININNKTFRHTFSSNSKYIKQIETGAIYNEAYDILSRNFNYEEMIERAINNIQVIEIDMNKHYSVFEESDIL